MVINGKTLRGHLTPNNVFEGLCAAFKSEPSACKSFQEKEGIQIPAYQSSGINTGTLVLIMMALLAVNVCIILIYRKNLNKEIKDEMTVNVTSAVNQYVALS